MPLKTGIPVLQGGEDVKKEAIIHLRVPAATKARWVRQSQAEGKKLSDWVREKVDGKAGQNANKPSDKKERNT